MWLAETAVEQLEGDALREVRSAALGQVNDAHAACSDALEQVERTNLSRNFVARLPEQLRNVLLDRVRPARRRFFKQAACCRAEFGILGFDAVKFFGARIGCECIKPREQLTQHAPALRREQRFGRRLVQAAPPRIRCK